MPIPGGGRYRVKTTDTGKKVRLHFGGSGLVDEAKNLKTGATHTPAEFTAAAKKASRFPGIAPKGDADAARARRVSAFERRHGGKVI